MNYMALYYDPGGICRAWAKAPSEDEARNVAAAQLKKYREEKRALGDWYMTDCAYTLEVRRLREIRR